MMRKLKRWLRNAALRVLCRPFVPGVDPSVLAADFRTACRSIAPMDSAGRPGSEASWVEFMNRMRDLALTEDPAEFLHWDVIEQTMSVGDVSYIDLEFDYLRSRADWGPRWREAIRESIVGAPKPYHRHPWTSRNLLHYAYHVAQFEEKTGRSLRDYSCIVEFGGGYGGMCRLCHEAGFRGTYIIFDLPLFSALQTYYLRGAGIPVATGDAKVGERAAVYVSSMQALSEALAGRDHASCLFIATWSLSECPLALREQFVPVLDGFGGYLVAYQERYHEANNTEFFAGWKSRWPEVRWTEWPIEHLPKPRSFYLVGGRSMKC